MAVIKKQNSLTIFGGQIAKGRLTNALVVFLIYFIYKFSSFDIHFRYLVKKIIYRILGINKIKVAGNTMLIDWNDAGLSKELVAYGGREFFSTKYIREFIAENDIIIGIGANIGYYTLIAAKKAKRGKVYAIEPVNENIKVLRNNIRLNQYKNCKTYRLAISSKEKISHIWVHEKKNWSSLKKLPGKAKKQIVNIITLDQFVKNRMEEKPTFVRMDVEGHELEILSGAKKLLGQKKLKIMMEIHPHYLGNEGIDKLLSILEKNGFRIKKIFLEINPQIFKFRNLYNCYRKIFGLMPYGEVSSRYYSFSRLAKMLKKKDSGGRRVYFTQVFLRKG